MKAELKKNSVNQIIAGMNIFETGDPVDIVGMVIKGRVRICAPGVNIVVGSGNFLGLCDLGDKIHHVTYTAETAAVIYAFPAESLNVTLHNLMKANREYASLMVSTLSKYILELSGIYDELEEKSAEVWTFLKESYQSYLSIAKIAGVKATTLKNIEEMGDDYEEGNVDLDMVEYYRCCASIPVEITKSYFSANVTITLRHIAEQVVLVNELLQECKKDALYIKKMMEPLILDDRSLYINVVQEATTLQHMGADSTEVSALFDRIIEMINDVENLLENRAGISLEVDHEFMEDAYFTLMNGNRTSNPVEDSLALVEENYISTDVLIGSLNTILDYAELEPEQEDSLRENLDDFRSMRDKFATDDDSRLIRRTLCKLYYTLYSKVFLKDYESTEKTPLVIDLFLRYGLLDETLVSEQIQEELLSLDHFHSGTGSCQVYDMKEWLTLIMKGEKEPSKSEFDLDYTENLRDMRKTGQITAEQQQAMEKDTMEKFKYEVENMFRTNHRLIFGQVAAFVPFLFTEGCITSLQRAYLSKDRVNAAIQRLIQIDFSVFYRESLYAKEGSKFAKEYIQEEVFPDIILMPGYGNKGVMWQELSGRRRNSRGRFLLPTFIEGDLEGEMMKLFGRFRWELCRTIQGSAWNNVQIKSLTSEYSDFIQFYRKNRELSEDKKEKLKLQIQKCRNSTREVFVVDYVNWVKHEAHGGLCLSKPVREIMATYCPFSAEMREKVAEQPMFRDAMARYNRECAKKNKEYDMKFKVWEKDGEEIPEEICLTRKFYTEF